MYIHIYIHIYIWKVKERQNISKVMDGKNKNPKNQNQNTSHQKNVAPEEMKIMAKYFIVKEKA